MKRWVIWLIIVLVAGVVWFSMSRDKPVIVSVTEVARATVESTVANTRAGTIKACLRSKLSLAIGGQIDQVLVREGDRVEQGQQLIVLWNRDRQARLRQAEAMLISARREREGVCVSSESDARESSRLFRLAERQLVAAETADLAQAKAEASAFRCQAAKAQQAEAEASVGLAQALLEQTHLYAPFAGQVAEVTGEVGEFSTPSPPGVATPPAIDLLTHDCHYVSAPIDEVDAAKLVPGMPVRIILDAFKGQHFPGRLRRIAPYVLDYEKQARTVEVEVEFESGALPEQPLLAGYSADVEVVLEAREAVLSIPTELLIEGSYVLVLDDSNVIQRQQVVTGLSNWRTTEIVDGLKPGDRVLRSLGLPGVIEGASARLEDSRQQKDTNLQAGAAAKGGA